MDFSGGTWSPDGRQLLAQGQPRSGTGETVAVAIDVTTGRAQRLAEVGVSAAWSPDGSTIASVRQPKATVAGKTGRRTQLILTNADGIHPRVLLEQFVADEDSERGHPGDEAWKWGLLSHVGPTNPVWSPTGQQIAFLAALPFDADGPEYPRQIEVWLYHLPTGRLTRVTHDDRWQLNLSWRQ
jgi:Tol biopolymer transport system component